MTSLDSFNCRKTMKVGGATYVYYSLKDAEKNGLAYQVREPKEAKRRQISYAENFRYDRKVPWTH